MKVTFVSRSFHPLKPAKLAVFAFDPLERGGTSHTISLMDLSREEVK